MKRLFTVIAVLITVTLFSCIKQENTTTEPLVTVDLQSTVAAGSSVSKGSSVLINLGTDVSKTVSWSAKPDTGLSITSTGNTASILFKSGGTFTITGTLGNTSGKITYTVKDSVVALPSSYKDMAFTSNEELILTAKKLGDTAGNGGIQIGGYTSQKYICGSWTRFTQTVSNNTLNIQFNGLLESLQPCATGTSTVYVGGGGITTMSPGSTYQLVIYFNGKIYFGSIAKSSAGKFNITWPYTNGVMISPLSL